MASFYGIGVGPGDSELLTIKAVNTIKKLDILYAPQAHKGGRSVAENIAHRTYQRFKNKATTFFQ